MRSDYDRCPLLTLDTKHKRRLDKSMVEPEECPQARAMAVMRAFSATNKVDSICWGQAELANRVKNSCSTERREREEREKNWSRKNEERYQLTTTKQL